MNTARLNGLLTTFAQQYAFPILANTPNDERRLRYLADGLAGYGLLVIMADVPANNYELVLRTWVDNYHRLYALLTANIFPSYTGINLGLADGERPPVAVLQGESIAVIQMLAGYIVPYVTMRQQSRTVSDAEIRGLMTYILDDLEASDIGTEKYNYIWREGAKLISQLITLPMRQESLTSMRKPLFQQVHLEPQAPAIQQKPKPPTSLPETGTLNPKIVEEAEATQAAKKKTQTMPIWFNSAPSDGTRLPPLPQPPKKDK